MKSLVVHGARDIRIDEAADPELSDDLVLVRTKLASVLMENVGMWNGLDPRVRGNETNPLFRAFPITMSGEVVGEVLSVGKNVDSIQPGERVASYAPYNELHVIKPDAWTRVGEAMDNDAAISLPFSGTTLHCVRRARLVVGDNVAVIG